MTMNFSVFSKNSLAYIGFLMIALFVVPVSSKAEMQLEVTKGMMEAMPIAVSDLYGEKSEEKSMGERIAGVITDDLSGSGLFKLIDQSSFLQSPADLRSQPRFDDWRMIHAQALLTGEVVSKGQPATVPGVATNFVVTFKLWDVFANQQMAAFSYEMSEKDWRRVAHKIADVVYKRLIGEEGYFDTRIVYIAETLSGKTKKKRLAIMDQDGANNKYITDDQNLVLTPRFSPNSLKVAYMGYYNKRPRVYILDLQTGFREVLGDFPNMTFAPRFSPDGQDVIMSLSKNGEAEVYEMNLKTKQIKQLTNSVGISTSPSYSPDGKQIVFESDRGGTQQLYVANRDGSDPKRISFGEGRYANPVWSPRGDLIAFTKLAQKKFHVGVIRPDGSGERILVQDYHVEGPTWAPNGRTLLYFKQEKEKEGRRTITTGKLYQIDLTGYFEREVKTPTGASDPAWSTILP